MQFFKLVTGLLLAGVAFAQTPKSHCISHCPDGTPFNSCVTYVRDPCADHQLRSCTGPDDFACKCKCDNSDIFYLCNAQYFRDPCAPLPKPVAQNEKRAEK
ncbi:hypothetical protein BJ878DRAFT_491921 [Calycina marina]|uniref:Uncharacterized protein n=1 Tax=Calycina marina TaxID=1763456 RepID=A0A9P7Z931_9HELO|nr:hypothetical protein BJ878DRAFT_491921 [Calycina marina]